MDKFINLDAEMALLGTIVIDNNNLARVSDILEPKHFYDENLQKLYSHLLKTILETSINSITLKDFAENVLKNKNLISNLLISAECVFDIRSYALVLIELWKKREACFIINEALEEIEQGKFSKVISKMENSLAGLDQQTETNQTKRMVDVAKEMDLRIRQGIKPKVIPTKINHLDQILGGGLFSKRLYVIMASAGSGKTSLALQLMIKAEENEKQTCFISMEMSADEATNKVISHLRTVPLWKLQRGIPLLPIEEQGKLEAMQLMENYNLSINDSPTTSPAQIERILKRELEEKPIQLLVIDYIQIMTVEKDRSKLSADLIKQNSTALKNLAKKYDIAVVLLSQVKRNDNKKPTLEDIKGSGGIGEDADMVIALFAENPKDKIKEVDFVINKNRWGRMADFKMHFDGEFGRFIETNNNEII